MDTIVLSEKMEALMGYRVNEPWKGHWHPSGGGQVPGDSYGETSAMHLKRDLGLVISPDQFELVSTASFPWSTSAQGVPCHLNGVLMAVRLSDAELASRTIPEKGDFAGSKFFPIREVTIENGFHPAIAAGARQILLNLERFGRLGTFD